MPGRDSSVQIVITARDEASRVLQDLKNKLVIFDEFGRSASVIDTSLGKASHSLTGFDAGMVRTARNVRELVVPALAGIEPALRGMSREFTGVLAAASHFSTGLAGVALAAAGVVGIIGAKLYETREQARELSRALQSVETGRIDGQMAKLREELDDVAEAMREVNRLARDMSLSSGSGYRPSEGAGYTGGVATLLFGAYGSRVGEQRDRALDRLGEALRARRAAEGGASEVAAYQAARERDQQEGKAAVEIFERIQRGAPFTQFIENPIDRAVAETRLSIRDQVDLLRRRGAGAAADQLEGLPGRLRAQLVTQQRLALQSVNSLDYSTYEQGALELYRYATPGAAISTMRDVDDQIREIQRRVGVDVALTPGMESFDQHDTPDFRRADRAAADAGALEDRLRFGRERADRGVVRARIAADLYGSLSARDRYRYSLGVIASERAALLADDRLTPDQRALREDELGGRASLLAREELERTDSSAGILRGFRDIQDAAESTGLVMQQFARDASAGMARTFSDGFFDLMTGKFRSLEDTIEKLGLSLARSLSDALGQVAANQLLSGFGGLFGGSANSVPFAGNAGLSLLAGGGGVPGMGGGGVIAVPQGAAVPAGHGVIGSTQIGGQSVLLVAPQNGGVAGYGGFSLSALLGTGLQGYGAIAGNPQLAAQGGGISALYNAGQLYSMYAPGAGAGFGVTAAGFYGSVAGLGGGLLSLAGGLAGNRQLTNAGALLSMVSTGIGLAGAVGAASAAGATAATTGAAGFLAAEAAATAAGAAAAGGAAAGGGLLSAAAAAGPYAAAAIIAALSIYNQTQLAGNWKSLPPSVKTGARVGAALGPGSSLPYLLGIDADVSGYFDPAFTYAGSLIGGFFVDSPSRRVREQINVATVLNPSAQAIIAHVNAAKTPQELWNTLVSWGSGYTGGTSSLAFSITVNGRTIGTANAYYDIATMDDLLEAPETVRVNVQLGVPQHYKDDVNRAVEDAIRAKVAALNAIFGAAPIGYTERVFGGAVSRATVEPFDPIALRGRGLALSGPSREQLDQIFDDDDLVETWLRRAVRVNGERQLGLLQPDGFPA